MAETTYKKGELLFEGDITTINPNNDTCAHINASIVLDSELNQDILVAEINGVEYVCEAVILNSEKMYGGITQTGLDFTKCPLFFNSYITDAIKLGAYSENPGTYNLKIYTAIEDTDSDSSSEPITIRSYIDKNLTNLNWNILPQIFEAEGVELTEGIKAYLKETPRNTNWNVFGSLGNGSEEILFDSMTLVYSMGGPTCQDVYDGREINIGDQFKVIVGEYTYQFTMETQGEPSISSKIEAGEPLLSFGNLSSGPFYTWILFSNDLQVGDEVQVKIVRTKKV